MIIQKFSGLEDTVAHGQHQSEESLELELSLVHQWKSLFLQMQDMYAQESSQLVSFNAMTCLVYYFNLSGIVASVAVQVSKLNFLCFVALSIFFYGVCKLL